MQHKWFLTFPTCPCLFGTYKSTCDLWMQFFKKECTQHHKESAETWLMLNQPRTAEPHKTTFKYYRVNKVLIEELDIALHLICGFWCIFTLFTHASSLNLVIFQSRAVTSSQNKPIKHWRCWHMKRDMSGGINHVPQNVYKEGRTSAKLQEIWCKEKEERWGTLIDECGVDLVLCLPTLNSTPTHLRLV